jgi:polysaccharide biosynthesis transport protein
VLAGLGAQVQAAKQHEADLRNQLAQEQAKASNLATVQAKLTQLQKDVDARRALYQSLLISAEQTQSTNKGPEQVDARVVSLATPPAFPASPRPKLAGALGLLSGMAFGGLISLLRGTARTAFTDTDDLEAETGLVALGAIPRLSGHDRSRGLAHVVAATPSGPEAEALRLARNKLRFTGRGPVPRALLFAAAVPGEGSSSVAAAFARTAALDGLRTLLIEANLEKPSLAKQLDVMPSNGIVETLLGNEHWRELVAQDRASGLEYLLADGLPVDAGRLLESMQLQNLIAEAREDYNFVVLDAQAVAVSPHILVLAHTVDAVVLVVEANSTSRSEIHAAVEALEGVAPPRFVMLNKA